MAKGKTKVELIVEAKGGPALKQSTDNIKGHRKQVNRLDKSEKKRNKQRERAYTRQKQGVIQTANSTKNFSKLQQSVDGGGGAGGLVRAYALLAANVFALTAAFGFLSRSAQIDTLNESMEILSTTGGTNIRNLAREMQAASGYAIELSQAMRQVSLAASAGLSTSEIEGLTMVARGAAISLGRNLPDAMDRIFRGAIKLEPEILDEIGLFVRVDEASAKYARGLNKTVSSLTQVEKRQAFLNEILLQGTNKFEEYAVAIKPDPYVRLAAALGDIAQSGVSLLNKVLGPILSYLAESKAALTLVFGLLVAVLLKKAIPAMGLFTQGVAEQAVVAAANARDYTDGLRATTSAQVAEDNKKIKSAKNKLEKIRQSDLRFVKQQGPVSQEKGAKALEVQLKKNYKGQQRLGILKRKEDQLVKQIANSQEKSSKLLEKDLINLRLERDNLREQVRYTNDIANNNERGAIAVHKKSLASKRQLKLDRKAGVAGSVAGIAGVAETQGTMAAFREMRMQAGGTFEHIDEGGNITQKSFGLMSRSAIRAKGALAIMTTGVSKLMMALGPIMMAFALLSPLLVIFSKWLGFNNEESKKLDETLSKVGDNLKTLQKRFKAQTDAVGDNTKSYIERRKATLAYNKGQNEAAQGVVTMVKELKDFNKELGTMTYLWEATKSLWGGDKASKVFKATLKGLKAQLRSALDVKDIKILAVFEEMIPGAKESVAAMKELDEATLNQVDGMEVLGGAWQQQISLNDTGATSISGLVQHLKDLDKEGFEKVITQAGIYNTVIEDALRIQHRYIRALAAEKDAHEAITDDVEKIGEAQEKIIKITKERIDVLNNLMSAFDGAKESIQKFQQAFVGRSKVDDALASFKSMRSVINTLFTLGAEEQKHFWQGFGADDNPFTSLFADINLTQLVITPEIEVEDGDNIPAVTEKIADATRKIVKDRFKDIIADMTEYRKTVIVAASAIKLLKSEQQELKKIMRLEARSTDDYTKAGATASALSLRVAQKGVGIANEKANVARAETKTLLVSLGISKEKQTVDGKAIDLGLEGLKTEETMRQRLNEILEVGQVSEIQALQVIAAYNEEQRADLEATITAANAKNQALKDNLLIQQEMNKFIKEELEATLKKFELEQQFNALMKRGTLDLNPREEAKAIIAAALVKLETTINEAKVKKAIIKLENLMLLERWRILNAESELKTGKGIEGYEAITKNLKDNPIFSGAAIDTQIENATSQFQLSMHQAVATAFGGGILDGIRTAKDALEEQIIAIKDMGLSKPDEDEAIAKATKATDMQVARGMTEATAESLKKLGPEGELVASMIEGAWAATDAWDAALTALNEKGASKAEKFSAIMGGMAATISALSSIMAASSKNKIAGIDNEIAAEKKRDGKSASSLAKIKALEAKKEKAKRKAFEDNKKMQMANVIISTAAAIAEYLTNWPMMILAAVMGAAQLAVISSATYQGGGASAETTVPAKIEVGSRTNRVDVSKQASAGELAYLRGAKGVGTTSTDFMAQGGAAGMRKGYADGGSILVGERGAETITPLSPMQVWPSGTGEMNQINANFTINAVDAAGVEEVLMAQQGNIISMIRSAANDYGTDFLEEIDTDTYGDFSTG